MKGKTLSALLTFMACAAATSAAPAEPRPFEGISSFVSDPERWNGGRFSLSAFLYITPEGDLLCTAQGENPSSECISVDLGGSYEERSNRYVAQHGRLVYLEGTFRVLVQDPEDQCHPPACFKFPPQMPYALTEVSVIALVAQ